MDIILLNILKPSHGDDRSHDIVDLPQTETIETETDKLLPAAAFLLVEYSPDSDGYLLNRYSECGEFGGDTWHESEEEVKASAAFEYGDALGSWEEIPPDTVDPLSYAVGKVKN